MERKGSLVSLVMLVSCAAAVATATPVSVNDMFDMSFDELLDVRIASVSKIPQKVRDAPANVIILTCRDLRDRGYRNFQEILDDLPGMDNANTHGIDIYNYWRGYRNEIGSSYLLLLDGLELNGLYFNTVSVLKTLPLSNIDHIEIIYGPASSVYGANAFNGVINVITRTEADAQPHALEGAITAGPGGLRLGDLTARYRIGDLDLRVSGRFENGDALPAAHDRYEYTRSAYARDRRLWGDFTEHQELGVVASPVRHRALDLRGQWGATEVAVQYFRLASGNGMEYAFDRTLPAAVWYETEFSAYGRHVRDLTEHVMSTTTLRYRESNVPGATHTVDAFDEDDGSGGLYRAVAFAYWQVLNSSTQFCQEFRIEPSAVLHLAAGVSYEQKNLQKAYDITSGAAVSPDSLDLTDYDYPQPLASSLQAHNRIVTEDQGVYLQGRYAFSDHDILHLGVRHDDNSTYGAETTWRGGFVKHAGRLTLKALYGEGFHEPTPRALYGGWAGLGSDPDLQPERSRTFELGLIHSGGVVSQTAGFYYIHNEDTILQFEGGARNAGKRTIRGVDYFLEASPQVAGLHDLRFWIYYSYIDTEGDEIYDAALDVYTRDRIGDIATHKVHFGVTCRPVRNITAVLLGRYIGPRPTVWSNPVDEIGDYVVVDLSLRYENIAATGLDVSLRIKNVTDREYEHPGSREANAGVTPGAFDGEATWQGSAGWYSSVLPQPGRQWYLSLGYAFD